MTSAFAVAEVAKVPFSWTEGLARRLPLQKLGFIVEYLLNNADNP